MLRLHQILRPNENSCFSNFLSFWLKQLFLKDESKLLAPLRLLACYLLLLIPLIWSFKLYVWANNKKTQEDKIIGMNYKTGFESRFRSTVPLRFARGIIPLTLRAALRSLSTWLTINECQIPIRYAQGIVPLTLRAALCLLLASVTSFYLPLYLLFSIIAFDEGFIHFISEKVSN